MQQEGLQASSSQAGLPQGLSANRAIPATELNTTETCFCFTKAINPVLPIHTPPHPTRYAHPAPQKISIALPREINKTRGAQRGKTDSRFH